MKTPIFNRETVENVGIHCRVSSTLYLNWMCSWITGIIERSQIDGKVGFTEKARVNLCQRIFGFTHPYGQEGYRYPSEGEAVRSLTVTFLRCECCQWYDKMTVIYRFLVQTDYQAKQTVLSSSVDSPMDHEQVGEEVYVWWMLEKYCRFTPYRSSQMKLSYALVSGCCWGRCEDHHTWYSG